LVSSIFGVYNVFVPLPKIEEPTMKIELKYCSS